MRRPLAVLLTSVLLSAATTGTAVLAAPASAHPVARAHPAVRSHPGRTVTRHDVLVAAAHYGLSRGYHVGVAVLDTETGHLYSAGGHANTFASESVVKVLIAARLFAQHRMHGSTRGRAYKMITQSDDSIASSLYGSVGGDGLISWVKRHYHVPSLGSPPHRSGWWGNTHLTPDGLVRLYAKLEADRHVGPWLLHAMHHAHEYGSDGFYQWFGLHQADPHAAIKQGWGTDYDDWGRSADENTTGFVGHNRYAVAILARGPASTYGATIGAMLSRTAKILLPGGRFPSGTPVITSLSRHRARLAGGGQLTIRGHDLDHASNVWVGGHHVKALHIVSPTRLTVVLPAHAPGRAVVRVTTSHGKSSAHGPAVTYVHPPAINTLSAPSGTPGQSVTISGYHLNGIDAVMFGTTAATTWTQLSSHQLQVVLPAHPAGPADVSVATPFGTSGSLPFSYDAG